MRKNNEVYDIKSYPFVWLALACLLVHSLFNTGAKYLMTVEGFFFLAFVFISFVLLFRHKIMNSFVKNKIIYTFLAFVVVVFLFMFLRSSKPLLFLFILELAILFSAFIILKINNKLNTANIAVLIFIASFFLHIIYILYTPYYLRQHDSYILDLPDGHLGYIQYLLNNNFKLMNSDPTVVWQFYHPPVHHYIAACWVKINTFLGMEYSRAIESIQVLTLFYSGCISIICYKIFKELHFKGYALLIPFTLVCFHPTFTILSGSINNDVLSILFIMLAILYTIKWYKSEKLYHIIVIALSVGFGMTTKLSVVLVTPAIAFVFLYKLVNHMNRRILMNQFAIFALICIPLGTWHSLYYYFAHGMELGFVHKLSNNSYLYIGDYSVYERLFGFKLEQLRDLYIDFEGPPREYNMLLFILKSSVFGEWSFGKNNLTLAFSILLFASNILAIVASVVAGIAYIIKNKRDNVLKVFFTIMFVTILGSYIKFCFDYPHVCSQDFRYIVPTFVIGTIAIGYVLNEKKNYMIANVIGFITFLFSFSSAMLFVFYGV